MGFQRKAQAGRKRQKKKGGTRVGTKQCISIYLGSAQDISEIRTGSSSRVSDVPSRDGLV